MYLGRQHRDNIDQNCKKKNVSNWMNSFFLLLLLSSQSLPPSTSSSLPIYSCKWREDCATVFFLTWLVFAALCNTTECTVCVRVAFPFQLDWNCYIITIIFTTSRTLSFFVVLRLLLAFANEFPLQACDVWSRFSLWTGRVCACDRLN